LLNPSGGHRIGDHPPPSARHRQPRGTAFDHSQIGSMPSIRTLWDRLGSLPGGTRLFNLALWNMAPYTGSVRPRVEELRSGYARVSMRDRRAVRNHLRSVHAIALLNLAEVSSGLALLYGLPDDARAILTGLSIQYLKKARGTLTAEASVEVPSTSEQREYQFASIIRNREGEIVAEAIATWLVGPRDRELQGSAG